MNNFYSTDIKDKTIFLSQEESNHCKNVFRMKEGDAVQAVDGKGNLYDCKISVLGKKVVELDIKSIKTSMAERNYNIHIAIAPTKNIDRMEWFVEKSIEIGIDEISFLSTARTERKQVNIERMEKIAVAAMKQSLKTFLPLINDIQPFGKFLAEQRHIHKQKFIAHLVEGEERKLLNKSLINGNDYLILVGPEGDFSPEEVKFALDKDFIPVSLGLSRLRTETAGIVACNTINLHYEE